MSDEQITIPKHSAQVLFDALCSSMDFGSGFLDTEEVEALRALAVALGVDPSEATPSEFESSYAHAFEPMPEEIITRAYTPYVAVSTDAGYVTERQGQRPDFTPCKVGTWGRWCGKRDGDPIHQAADDERLSA